MTWMVIDQNNEAARVTIAPGRIAVPLGEQNGLVRPFDIMPDGYGAPVAAAFVRMNRERFDPQLVEQFLHAGDAGAD
jgi:hypothetical protein